MIDITGANAAARAGIAGSRVRAGNIRIGAVVDIEEGSLRAFKQHVFTLAENFVQHHAGIGDVRAQFFGIRQKFFQHRIIIKRLAAINFSDDSIFRFQIDLQFFGKSVRLHQITDTDAGTGNLIHITGTDTALGRTDLIAAQSRFLQLIQAGMIRQHHMGTVRNDQIVAADAFSLHISNFVQNYTGVDNDAVTQHIRLVAVQNTGGKQTQFIGNVIDDYRMTCVRTAGITYDGIGFLCQIINDLTFTFIAPLGTNNYNR